MSFWCKLRKFLRLRSLVLWHFFCWISVVHKSYISNSKVFSETWDISRKGLIKGSTALCVDMGEVSVPLASVGPRPGGRPQDVACPCALLRGPIRCERGREWWPFCRQSRKGNKSWFYRWGIQSRVMLKNRNHCFCGQSCPWDLPSLPVSLFLLF